MIQIIPAIDIIDGRCVRLTKGDYGQKKVYDSSPVDMALKYADCGVSRIHLVDLDGAKASAPMNLKTLEQISSKVDVEIEWGGGIADAALPEIRQTRGPGRADTPGPPLVRRPSAARPPPNCDSRGK